MSCGWEIKKSMTEFLHSMPSFSDLGEDSGERAHREEARNESRVGAVVNLATKERTKSQFEAMLSHFSLIRFFVSNICSESFRTFSV